MASQYHGTDADLRSLYRKGSGMTLRRLMVLIRGLPAESWLVQEITAAVEHDEKVSTVDQLRAREAHYASKGGGQ